MATVEYENQPLDYSMPPLLKLGISSAPDLDSNYVGPQALTQTVKVIYHLLHINKQTRQEAKQVLAACFRFYAGRSVPPCLRDYVLNLFSPTFGTAVYTMCFYCGSYCESSHFTRLHDQTVCNCTCFSGLSGHALKAEKSCRLFRIASVLSEVQIWLQLCVHQSFNALAYEDSSHGIRMSIVRSISHLKHHLPNVKFKIHVLVHGQYKNTIYTRGREEITKDIVDDLFYAMPRECGSIEIGEVRKTNPVCKRLDE